MTPEARRHQIALAARFEEGGLDAARALVGRGGDAELLKSSAQLRRGGVTAEADLATMRDRVIGTAQRDDLGDVKSLRQIHQNLDVRLPVQIRLTSLQDHEIALS